MKIKLLLILSLVVPSLCFGHFLKPEDFVDGAKAFADESYRDDNIKAMKFGIFIGVINENVREFNNKVYTVPRGAKLNQILRVVSKYVIENPENWHLPPSNQSVNALMVAFPLNKAEAEAEQKRIDANARKILDEYESQSLKD
jgi:hypothetical protein